jgi:hypothetical protein
MRINSWGQSAGVSGIQAFSAACAEPPCESDADEIAQGAAQIALSPPAELFQKLTALQQSDPTAFKRVTNEVAMHFEHLASNASGAEARALVLFARRFASAAQNGDLSALAPATPPAAPEPPAAPPSPPAPAPVEPPPAPIDAVETAFSLLDALAPAAASGASSDPLARLHALKDQSPSAFKKLMNDVAMELEHRAALAQGSDRENLHNLALTFATRAESRDLSAIDALRPAPEPAAPPPPPPAPPPPPPPEPAPPVDVAAVSRTLVESLTSGDGSSTPLARLNALKTSDLTAFKRVMNEVAQELEALASFEDGDDRQSLQSLAGTFASAAQSRNLSALEGLWPAPAAPAPPAPPPPPPPAPAPEPEPPVDAVGTAFSLVDGLVPAAAGDSTSTTLSRLAALKTSDAAGFKRVVNDVAQQLEALASFEDGDDRQNLLAVAQTFASSAQRGDLSKLEALLPPPSPPAPAPEPEPAPPPAAPEPPPPPPPPGWRYRQAQEAYLQHVLAPGALDGAFASALALVDTLTGAAT